MSAHFRLTNIACGALLLAVLAAPSLSARGREDMEHGQVNQRTMHNIERADMQRERVIPKHATPYDRAAYDRAVYDRGAYGSGAYGTGAYGSTPVVLPPGSQPGMSDDSSALYRSYQANPPGN